MRIKPDARKAVGIAFLLSALMAGLPAAAASAAEAAPAPALSEALDAYAFSPLSGELAQRAGSAVRLGADPATVAEFIAGAGTQGVPDRDVLAALNRAEHLAGDRLPVGPVLSRYMQGLAKGIPFARIETVVDGLEAWLVDSARRIDTALPAPADPAGERARLTAIDHGAYALSVGVSEAALDRSIQLAAKESRPVEAAQAPVLALGVLVASGANPEKSWEVVNAAWRNGYRGEDLERLGKALGRLSRDGQGPPAEVMDQVLAQIGSNAGRDRVFEGLDALCGDGGGRSTGAGPGAGKGQDPARDRPDNDRGQGDPGGRGGHGGGRSSQSQNS
jgi:hypothetical protein